MNSCYCCLVAKSCPKSFASPGTGACQATLSMISWARVLACIAISFSRGSSLPRDQTLVSSIGRQIVYHRVIREAIPILAFIMYLIAHSFWSHPQLFLYLLYSWSLLICLEKSALRMCWVSPLVFIVNSSIAIQAAIISGNYFSDSLSGLYTANLV